MRPTTAEGTEPRFAADLRVLGMVLLGIGLGVVVTACGGSPAAPSPSSSLSVGQWSGTTAQGAAIAFSVSPDEYLTTISVGYNFNGCFGTQVFSNLYVPTAPNVICIPGPCPDTSYRSLHYSNGTRGAGPVTTLDGLFLPGGRAQGVVAFQDYPGCGTATSVEWTATRR